MQKALVAAASVAIALGLSLGAAAYAQGKKGKAARIGVDAVVQEPVSQTMPVIGRFVARQQGVIAAATRGPIAEVLVDAGDRVNEGQVLARLVSERLKASRDLRRAELREKEAAQKAAQAQLKLSMGEMDRLDKLRLSAAFSKARFADKQNEVLKYESEVGEAEAAVAQAKANLRLAEIDLYNADIRAPYDAIIAQRHVAAGNFVAVGDKVVTLINDRILEIEADVPSDRLSGLQTGRRVSVRLDDGSAHAAVIRAVIPAEKAMTRTRPVRLVPLMGDKLPPMGLAVDQSVTVDIPISAARDVVTVHKDGVISRTGASHVFVVKGSVVEKRMVTLGRAVGTRFEVLSGLEPGEVVAVKGNERLIPGQRVTAEEQKPAEAVRPEPKKPASGVSG
ncbi:MAG: efflux RND transporter periplasmic adaptor subunit [Pseudomonadota bacterium]